VSPTPKRAISTSPAKKPAKQDDLDVGLDGANLVFKEFSFVTEDGGFDSVSAAHMVSLKQYLDSKYGVSELIWSSAFLIITCREKVPPSNQRPFTIAGCVGVWLAEGDAFPWGLLPPTPARGEDLELPDHLANDLEPYKLPKIKTLIELWRCCFPEALQVQYYVSGVIIELPEVSLEVHSQRIDKLPNAFANSCASLSFTNGPRPLTQLARLKQPYPSQLNGDEDDTDYIQSVGFASPGVMIGSSTGQQISAGILLESSGEQRLTTAIHCWDTELDTKPEKFGDSKYFTLTQGQTLIGHLTERIGTTDIGLATLKKDITFSNRFLDIPTSAKSLLVFKDIKLNDQFIVDSFVTGTQKLICLGCIVQKADRRERDIVQKRDGMGQHAPLPGDGSFMMLSQGIYATSAPENHSSPKIRAGVCGAALVRCRKAADKTKMEEVLAKGEIGGFMHWSDLQKKSTPPGELICISDCLDQLVQEGWTVVQETAKRARQEEQSTEEIEEAEGSAAKKVYNKNRV
jgi:hypothetical protein